MIYSHLRNVKEETYQQHQFCYNQQRNKECMVICSIDKLCFPVENHRSRNKKFYPNNVFWLLYETLSQHIRLLDS